MTNFQKGDIVSLKAEVKSLLSNENALVQVGKGRGSKTIAFDPKFFELIERPPAKPLKAGDQVQSNSPEPPTGSLVLTESSDGEIRCVYQRALSFSVSVWKIIAGPEILVKNETTCQWKDFQSKASNLTMTVLRVGDGK